MKYKNFKIIENKLGYFEVFPKPSNIELNKYYSLKYYQNQSGNYRKEYSREEYIFLNNKEIRKIHILENYLNIAKSSVLDLGCGEGFSLNHFHKLGWTVLGIDFSNYGIKKNNPEMEKYFIEGDLLEMMNELKNSNKLFNVITLNNLLEHVSDPGYTIDLSLELLSADGVLIVEVPNDFSRYQNFLMNNNFINDEFWVSYPDHLSYFNKVSLNSFMKSKNMSEVFSLADFPIDIFLSNNQSNYVLDKSKGKDAHKSRILVDNFLNAESIENTIELYRAMANIGLGRQIISFFKKQ
jgi:2-polyprenyl-3-methyl-5-hydroxy-6-metoxy-1,4-benzoquinol methylase